ncbi:MAG TPA: V-type ATPase subunit [Candidatus Hydrogenedentes bacterium]|nr:V-type ATPase subunit [Candidatus Hydrogenedentota bacterium]
MLITLTTEQQAWGFVCGQVAVLEGGLLPRDFFHALAGVERQEDLLHRLQDTPLREYVTPGAGWEEWNDVVDRHFHQQMREVRANSPVDTLSAMFLLAGDYLNLKRAVLGRHEFPFEKSLFSEERLHAAAAGDYALLPAETRVALTRLGGSTADPAQVRAQVDLVLDGAYLRHMQRLADEMAVPLIAAYVSDFTLAKGVALLLRLHGQGLLQARQVEDLFLPVGEHTHVLRSLAGAGEPKNWASIVPGPLGDAFRAVLEQPEDQWAAQFELLAANHLMRYARQGKLQTMGPERVAAYFVGFRAQAYNFKLVVSGRFNGLDPEVIRRRLRECYV